MTRLKYSLGWISCALTLSLAAGCVENKSAEASKAEDGSLNAKASGPEAKKPTLQQQLDDAKAQVEKDKADAEDSAKKAADAETELAATKTAMDQAARKSAADLKASRDAAEQTKSELNRTQASTKHAEDTAKAARQESAALKTKVSALQDKVDGMTRAREDQDRELVELQKRFESVAKKASTVPATMPVK